MDVHTPPGRLGCLPWTLLPWTSAGAPIYPDGYKSSVDIVKNRSSVAIAGAIRGGRRTSSSMADAPLYPYIWWLRPSRMIGVSATNGPYVHRQRPIFPPGVNRHLYVLSPLASTGHECPLGQRSRALEKSGHPATLS